MNNSGESTARSGSFFDERLHRLEAAVAHRADAERAFAEQFRSGPDPEQEGLSRCLAEVVNQHAEEEAALQDDFAAQRREVESQFAAERNAAQQEYDAAMARAQNAARSETDRVTRQHEDSRWVATSVLDETAEESPKRQFERARANLEITRDQQSAECVAIHEAIQEIAEHHGWSSAPQPAPESDAHDLDSYSAAFTEAMTAARERLSDLGRLTLPRLFVGTRPVWTFAALIFAIGLPIYLFVPPSAVGITADRTDSPWIAISAGAALMGGVLLLTILYTLSSMRVSDVFSHLQEHAADARHYHERWSDFANQEIERREREYAVLHAKHEQQLQRQLERYEATHQQTLADVERRRQSTMEELSAEISRRMQSLETDETARLTALDHSLQQQLTDLRATFRERQEEAQSQLDRYVAQRRRQQAEYWEQLSENWFAEIRSFREFCEAANADSQRMNLAWAELAKPTWQPAAAIPAAIRLGEFAVDLADIKDGVTSSKELAPEQTTFRFPAAMPFPESASLLLETKGPGGRRDAVQAMQVALLRMLTRIPPGKLRLTVIDPLGLGESFSGLMHLADFDELLITSRIWTETGQIEARLSELTEHMENVLQKYLRNEFATIEEYNHFAGEVAEPYRVLVVADFPNKFSEQAARRLVSIATSGPRCGVYLLMSVDRTAQMPNAFDLTAIEATADPFVWNQGAFYPRSQASALGSDPRSQASAWERTAREASASQGGNDPREGEASAELLADERDPLSRRGSAGASPSLISRWPLLIDAPPSPEVFTQIVKNVGEASKDIRRVEVSFARIAPKPEDVWSKDSRTGIDIPLGRAGATKLQHLRLGKGTSQHMLVAGKTGSGKSTFFHTLITNVALYYSPDEIELYLVDFKKGVEFKAYAPKNGSRGQSPVVGGPWSAASDESEETTRMLRPSASNGQRTTDNGRFPLPHARVIAIESDREFGVSVLQRLDAVLQERGELFRRHNVQDIASYRDRVERRADSGEGRAEYGSGVMDGPPPSALRPPLTLPRILLIIDEFQEFFVEDDRYSQQAALLLDRLVRQGRAFGVHVILGSQTLGGAYSLARSTLGQVAVRVALQCSEADAHLILSEENTAARLLTRPGEAIYNDANGLVEGNHPFQIAWLPDEERAGYLGVIEHFAQERGISVAPPIVFEGNVPSDPARNVELMSLVSRQSSVVSSQLSVAADAGDAPFASSPRTTDHGPRTLPPRIWLGESVDIGPPTGVTFAPQTASNLLIVGSETTAAAGILSTSLIALASSPRVTPRGYTDDETPRFYIFDGSVPGSPEADLWQRIADVIPAGVRLITPQTSAQAIEELTAERHRRDGDLGQPHSPLFVIIGGLSKFRDLRKSEDEFSLSGFGSSSGEQAPDLGRQFADLLAKGPELGMHTLAWADSFSNADRWLSRQSLREFEIRVALPMNAADSSNLIDSPAASRLGVHRALLYREDTGTSVKFRPYGPPSREWLDWVHAQLTTPQPMEEATTLEGFHVT